MTIQSKIISQAEYETLQEQGYQLSTLGETVWVKGRAYKNLQLEKPLSSTEQCAHMTSCLSCYLFSTALLSCCYVDQHCKNCCDNENFTERFCYDAMDGVFKMTRYLLDEDYSTKTRAEEFKRLGFNTDNIQSMNDYMIKHASQVRSYLGHEYLVFFYPVSKRAGVLFCPHGDRSMIKNLNADRRVTTNPLTTGELHAYVQNYCRAYRPGMMGMTITGPGLETTNPLTVPLLCDQPTY